MEMLPWRQTNKRRTISENRASQQIDQGLLTFAMNKEPRCRQSIFVLWRILPTNVTTFWGVQSVVHIKNRLPVHTVVLHRPLHCSLGFQLDILLFFNYRSSCLSVVQLSPSVYLSSTFNHHSPLFLVGLQIVCILNDWRSALKYMWFTSFFSDMNRVDFVVGLGTSVLTWRPSVWNVPWDNSFSVPL